MRELKFRVWQNGKFWYWGFIKESHGISFRGLVSTTRNRMSLEDIQAHSEQYTGLKDKNGREIYEGDIVTGRTDFERDDDDRQWTVDNPCLVQWQQVEAGFCPFTLNARWRCDVMDIEVVGNIHEGGGDG